MSSPDQTRSISNNGDRVNASSVNVSFQSNVQKQKSEQSVFFCEATFPSLPGRPKDESRGIAERKYNSVKLSPPRPRDWFTQQELPTWCPLSAPDFPRCPKNFSPQFFHLPEKQSPKRQREPRVNPTKKRGGLHAPVPPRRRIHRRGPR